MIGAWLGAKALFGLSRGLWVAIVAGLIALAVLWFIALEKADDRANQEIGATVQREGDLRETIERTEQGNEAREEIKRDVDRGGGAVLYEQCLRTARTPANCGRFLPERQTDQR
jgi:hypothetical protein